MVQLARLRISILVTLFLVGPLVTFSQHLGRNQTSTLRSYESVLYQVNLVREERSLLPVKWSSSLHLMARVYAQMLSVSILISHDLMTSSEKMEIIQNNWDLPMEMMLIDEVLAVMPKDLSPYEIAHCFDNSPTHAIRVYHPDQQYTGWGIVENGDWIYICAYFARGIPD